MFANRRVSPRGIYRALKVGQHLHMCCLLKEANVYNDMQFLWHLSLRKPLSLRIQWERRLACLLLWKRHVLHQATRTKNVNCSQDLLKEQTPC